MYQYRKDYPGVWENGQIYGRSLATMLEASPTPLFVVSPARSLENSTRFVELTRSLTEDRAEVFYSVKTCCDPQILRMIAQSSVRAEVVGNEELKLARDAGFSRFIVDGAWKSSTLLKETIESNCQIINIGDANELSEIDAIAQQYGIVQPIGMRLRLPHQNFLGLSSQEFELVLENLSHYRHLLLSGLHVHAGFNILAQNIQPIIDTLQWGASTASAYGQHITTFDVGGSMAEMAAIENDLNRYVAMLVSSLLTMSEARLIFEPGRLIVGDVATLVVSVVRRTSGNVLIIDASAELLSFLSGQTPLIGVWAIGRPLRGSLNEMTVRGIWESDHDYITVQLPTEVIVGDKLLFFNCGAYALSFTEAFSPYRTHIMYID